MNEKFSRHFDVFKWSADFILVPLHWMGLQHLHWAATMIGTGFLVTYVAASIYHARVNGFRHQQVSDNRK